MTAPDLLLVFSSPICWTSDCLHLAASLRTSGRWAGRKPEEDAQHLAQAAPTGLLGAGQGRGPHWDHFPEMFLPGSICCELFKGLCTLSF